MNTTPLAVRLQEGQRDLLAAIGCADQNGIREKLGDMLFLLTRIANTFDLAAEECLHGTANTFVARFKEMERLIKQDGGTLEELDTVTLHAYWRETTHADQD